MPLGRGAMAGVTAGDCGPEFSLFILAGGAGDDAASAAARATNGFGGPPPLGSAFAGAESLSLVPVGAGEPWEPSLPPT